MEILAMVKVSVVWRLWLWRLAIKSTRLFFTFRMHPVRSSDWSKKKQTTEERLDSQRKSRDAMPSSSLLFDPVSKDDTRVT